MGRGCSTALTIGAAAGLLQALCLTAAAPLLLAAWGAFEGASLQTAALQFFQLRALAAPATVLLLVLQGVFRGVGDTRAVLVATLAATVLNVVLDPLLIYEAGLGVRGAAIATGAAEVR